MTTHNDTTVKPDKESAIHYTQNIIIKMRLQKKEVEHVGSERSRLDMTGGIDRRGMYVRRTESKQKNNNTNTCTDKYWGMLSSQIQGI